MDRLTEIRQRTEAATDGPRERFDTPYYAEIHILGGKEAGFLPVALADEAYNGLKWAIDTANANAKLFDEATARAEAAEAERDAAVEDMTAVLKRDSDDICAYCKNRIECKNEQCEKYSSGVGDVDGNYPDWKWTCMDFDYGTCSLLADTPCNGCFDDDCKGFEWRGPVAGKGDALNE